MRIVSFQKARRSRRRLLSRASLVMLRILCVVSKLAWGLNIPCRPAHALHEQSMLFHALRRLVTTLLDDDR